jgi:hypothetical protein
MVKQIVVKKFPADLWRHLKIQAAKEGLTMQEILARAVSHYLEHAA